MKRVLSISVTGFLLLFLAVDCTTATAPSRLDTFLCDDEIIVTEAGLEPPAASCVPIIKWPNGMNRGRQPAQCGPRIGDDDVRVVEIADMARVTDPFVDASGRYGLEGAGWFGIEAKGYEVATTNRVRSVAANAGCPLLLLGPVLSTERRWEGRVTTIRYRLVRLGSPAGP